MTTATVVSAVMVALYAGGIIPSTLREIRRPNPTDNTEGE